METDMEEKWEEGEGESPEGKKWLHQWAPRCGLPRADGESGGLPAHLMDLLIATRVHWAGVCSGWEEPKGQRPRGDGNSQGPLGSEGSTVKREEGAATQLGWGDLEPGHLLVRGPGKPWKRLGFKPKER